MMQKSLRVPIKHVCHRVMETACSPGLLTYVWPRRTPTGFGGTFVSHREAAKKLVTRVLCLAFLQAVMTGLFS